MTIKIMDETLANKIAAGEVVERPRSIVKELVENALDAGATEIKIILEQAGIRKITVIDNGSGMDQEDALLAFSRHATSKIFAETDLFSIRTLGFRGEALAALAAVSKVKLITGLRNEPATELALEGGIIVEQKQRDSVVGTTIEVAQLFYNTPARLKHLKALATEYGHTLTYLQKMALARPDVRLEFIHDDKQVFKTYGTGELAETLVMIYGENIAPYLFPFTHSDSDFSLSGIMTHPQVQRSHNRVMHIALNGRSIRHFGINQAILRGYGRLLPKGMFPIIALDVRVDPQLVDVNVHPAKLEVRISQERQLEQLIEKVVKDTLIREDLLYKDVARPQQIRSVQQAYSETQAETIRELPNLNNREDQVRRPFQRRLSKEERTNAMNVYQLGSTELERGVGVLRETTEDAYVIAEQPVTDTDVQVDSKASVAQEDVTTYEQTTETFVAAREALRSLHVIGQFNASYILAQMEETLFLIDQHAAQERIKYDAHMRKVRAMERIVTQDLLFPLTLFLEMTDLQIVFAMKAELLRNGIDFDAFSEQEIRIHTVPAWIQKENIEAYVRQAIACVIEYGTVDNARIREKELIMLSCRYSIKAHDVLSRTEMQHLLNELSETDVPFTCPHGRPIVIKHQLYEIERWFKRV